MATGCLHPVVGQRRLTVARVRVDLHHLAGVGEIRVHLAVAGRHTVLRFAAERNVRDQFSGAWIDRGGGMRIAVQGEHAVRGFVVEDGIGVFRGRDAARRLERLRIEHDHGLVVADRGEAVSRAVRDRGAVRAFDVGDFAEQLAAILIDHHHASLTRDEQTMIRRIGHDVIPAPVAASV